MTYLDHDFAEPPPSHRPPTLVGGGVPRSTISYHAVYVCVEMLSQKKWMVVNIRWRGREHRQVIDVTAAFNAADPCKYVRNAIVRWCQTGEVDAPPCIAELIGDIYHIDSGWFEFIKHATLDGAGSATLDRIVFNTFAPWSKVATEYYTSRIKSDHRIGVLTQLLMTLSIDTILTMTGSCAFGRAVLKLPEIHHRFRISVTPHELSSYMRLCLGCKVEPIVKTVDDLRETPAYLGWNDEDRTLGERVMLAYNHRLRML